MKGINYSGYGLSRCNRATPTYIEKRLSQSQRSIHKNDIEDYLINSDSEWIANLNYKDSPNGEFVWAYSYYYESFKLSVTLYFDYSSDLLVDIDKEIRGLQSMERMVNDNDDLSLFKIVLTDGKLNGPVNR